MLGLHRFPDDELMLASWQARLDDLNESKALATAGYSLVNRSRWIMGKELYSKAPRLLVAPATGSPARLTSFGKA
jgi:hypothetical protein